MKPFGKVESRFWISQDILKLSDQGKLLALYLLSCPHGNMLGVFRLPKAYIIGDLKWNEATVSRTLHELATIKFISVCDGSDYVCINQFIRHNDTTNAEQFTARLNDLEALPEQVPDLTLLLDTMYEKASVYKGCKDFQDKINALRGKFVGRSSESRLERKREREIESKRVNTLVRSARRTSDDEEISNNFDKWWQQYPKREGSQGNRKTAFKRYKTRQKEFSAEQLLMAVMRYGRFCNETDKTGTQYVMQATTFLNNPDNITNPWTVNHEARQSLTPYQQALKANEADLIEGGYLQPKVAGDGEAEPHSGAVYDHDPVVSEQVDTGVGVFRQE